MIITTIETISPIDVLPGPSAFLKSKTGTGS